MKLVLIDACSYCFTPLSNYLHVFCICAGVHMHVDRSGIARARVWYHTKPVHVLYQTRPRAQIDLLTRFSIVNTGLSEIYRPLLNKGAGV